MKKNYRRILYPLFSLIILSGLFIFLFRNQLLDFLRARENLTAAAVPAQTASVANESLDLTILKSPRFTTLTNNVVNFDFDNICYRPNSSAVISQTAADLSKTTDIATGTATLAAGSSPLNCVRGNNLPFSLK